MVRPLGRAGRGATVGRGSDGQLPVPVGTVPILMTRPRRVGHGGPGGPSEPGALPVRRAVVDSESTVRNAVDICRHDGWPIVPRAEDVMSSLRQWALGVGAVAAVLLFYLFNPWVSPPEGTISQIVTIAFWVSFLVLLGLLFMDRDNASDGAVEIQDPAFARYLFRNSNAGIFWLPIRLFVGFSFLEAGWHKFTDPAWTSGGTALRGYWEGAVAIPAGGRPPITFEWYRDFIQTLLNINAEPWFAWLVLMGELAIGVGLILGMLTGIAAFFGALMNMSFLLAGSGSTNPVLFMLGIGLILAWRVAGYYGLDRYLLPALGAPWSRGSHAAAPREPALT